MVLLAALALAQAPQTLALRMRVGDSWTTEFHEQLRNLGEEFDESDVWVEQYRVIRVEAVGATVSFTRTFQYTQIGQDKIPPAKGTTPETGEMLLLPGGGFTRPKTEDASPQATRLRRLDSLGVRFPTGPVPIGQEWSYDLPRLGAVPDARTTWRLDSLLDLAERKVAVVSFRVVENPTFDFPMESSGTRDVDLVSGVVLQESGTTRNYPVPGGDFRVDRIVTRKLLKVHMPRDH
ncbi:MAG: hypothetical protein M9921_07815 [Fimbriimonadaceae bacterium]|nr:hypothetical protein [Fimbriimonadaceae bacterium]